MSLRQWLVTRCTRLLTKPLASYVQRVPNSLDSLRQTLRKGDVLLVEGDQRVSQVIRWFTQSSWSHSALYAGDALLQGDAKRAAELKARFGTEASQLLIEAVMGEGVIASPLSKYERYNIRICRPDRLRKSDVGTVIEHAAQHLGDSYDVQHVYDLARYFFPFSIVPRRWRRAALHFGAGSDREVICSGMIARAFASVGFPIAPQVTLEDNVLPPARWKRWIGINGHEPLARFRRQDPGLITPRDFDLSPYFEIIKFNHLGDSRFSYRDIVWEETDKAATKQETGKKETPATPESAATV